MTENSPQTDAGTSPQIAAADSPQTTAAALAGRGVALRAVVPVLVRDVVLPYAVYYFLHREGVANVPALAASAARPAPGNDLRPAPGMIWRPAPACAWAASAAWTAKPDMSPFRVAQRRTVAV